MKKKVSIEEAQSQLPELIDLVLKGKEVIILDKHKPVARLSGIADKSKDGGDKWTSEDFDIKLSD